MNTNFDLLIDSYLASDVGVHTSFFSETLSQGLQENIRCLHKAGDMPLAGIGNAKEKDTEQKMRGDRIHWLDKSNNNAFENEFLELAEAFISRLNSTCYTGISNYEFHYALYEKGSFYKRHKDQFKSDDKRKFSLINYLNDDWLQEDGGALCIYQNNEVREIEPQSKTAVFFQSNETEHEVALCHKSRMSISGWLKTS